MRPATLSALLVFAATPALAQDRPPQFPTRDVAVTYRITAAQLPPGAPQTLNMAWIAATQAVRVDIPGTGYVIADKRSNRAFMVMEAQRMVVDLPMEQAMQQFNPSPTATFRREGTDTVAGVACNVWTFEDRGNQGRACITNDGVTLRAQGTSGGQSGGMEATQVTYGAQNAARFQRPQGYQTMQVPGQPGGAPAR